MSQWSTVVCHDECCAVSEISVKCCAVRRKHYNLMMWHCDVTIANSGIIAGHCGESIGHCRETSSPCRR